MNINKALTTIALTGAFLATAGIALADGTGYGTSNCQVIYGGGQVCPTSLQFSLDKKVQNPTKGGDFIDNLGFNDAKYLPGSEIAFKMIVKNTGDTTIDQLTVIDTLPSNLSFTAGVGNYDQNMRTVTYIIKNLPKGESNEQTIVAKIDGTDKLPQDQGVMCLTNKAKATDNNGNVADDASAFCIQKQAVTIPDKNMPKVYNSVPPKSIPNTGPEMLPLIGLIPAGIAGLVLRKKTKLS